MLYAPRYGCQRAENNVGVTSSALGTAVVAGGTAHTKNTTYTTLISATAYNSFGIAISFENTAAASNRRNALVDIALGAASSEVVIIPNLMAGNAGTSVGTQGFGQMYYFPIMIPAGVRVSATAQSNVASLNVYTSVYLFQHSMAPGAWIGSRVTDYGVNTTTSSATVIQPGNGSYTTGAVSGGTANPIKYLQFGTDLYTASAGTTARGSIEILEGSNVLVDDLPYHESTTLESVDYAMVNFALSKMQFNIPAGATLLVGAQRNVAAADRAFALYGVD
jgi:hypothetical protein